MKKCTYCIHPENDCGFPDCMGGWEAVYKDLQEQLEQKDKEIEEIIKQRDNARHKHDCLSDKYPLLKARNDKLERVISGNITNDMKALCHGYFSWKEDAPYYDENGELHEYEAERNVPWYLMKKIYKAMLKVSLNQLSEVNDE